jgi:hypothetical protein
MKLSEELEQKREVAEKLSLTGSVYEQDKFLKIIEKTVEALLKAGKTSNLYFRPE